VNWDVRGVEPALVFAVVIAGTLLVSLTVDLTITSLVVLTNVVTTIPFGIGRAARPVVAGVMLLTLLRVGPAGATTPPPSVRLVSVQPSGSNAAEAVDTESRPQDGPSAYEVQRGDSLWRIARRLLETRGSAISGSDITLTWRAIYDLNKAVIGDDPNLIHPGQVLELPGV
jgi:nucleoid-associated protein YgaU